MTEKPILLKRTLSGLSPKDKSGQEALDAIPVGSVVRVRISKPRIHKHAAKFWVLCSVIADAIGPTVTSDMVASVIKLRTGHTEVVRTAHGIVEYPASIAFHRMDQDSFNAFFERALVVVQTQFLPGVTKAEIKAQIEDLIGVK